MQDAIPQDTKVNTAGAIVAPEQAQEQSQTLGTPKNSYECADSNINKSTEKLSLDELFACLVDINTKEGAQIQANTWASSDGINQTLEYWLEGTAHIINTELSSVETPVSSEEGAINYAKKIVGYKDSDGEVSNNGFVHEGGGVLKKPVVMILNTQVAVASHRADAQAVGGIHWQACVILPKQYKPLFAESLNNENEIVFYLDSLYPNIETPTAFKEILTKGASYSFNSDKGKKEEEVIHKVIHEIPALCSEAKFIDGLTTKQQLGGVDCGWWALHNALMLVFTGRVDYLAQFTEPSRAPAYKLRVIFPNLGQLILP